MSEKRLKHVAALVGVTLLTVIIVGALVGSRAAADDLQTKSERALRAAHLDGVHVTFHGREAMLKGGTPDDLDRAQLIVEGIEGVRWADVEQIAVTPTSAPDTTPTLRLKRSGAGITISGTVPSADAAAGIKADVAEAFGVAVRGDLVIDPAVGTASWIHDLPDVFGDIIGVKRLALTIDGKGTLDLGGSIESRAGAADVRRLLASTVDALDVVSRLDVRPGELSPADAAVLNTTTVYFAAGRSRLGVGNEDKVDAVADVLRRNPGAMIEVAAHVGPQHPSAAERLGLARVAAVRARLIHAGVDAGRISTRILASHRRTADPSAEQFRRVDFVVKAG